MKAMFTSAIVLLILFTGCTREKSETSTRGNLHVLVPESTVPAALDEIREFLNQHASDGAKIEYQIVSSGHALQRLGRDSIRFVFSTRPMTATERQQLPQTEGFELSEVLIAYDAVAVVVHEKNLVTKVTTTELTKILSGEFNRWEQLSKAGAMRGTIELVLQDSSDITSFADARILQGQPLRKGARLTSSSMATLQLVAAQPLAVGLVGITWVDSARVAAKILDIAETRQAGDTTFRVPTEAFGKFYSPHPANIHRSYYPLKRANYAYWYAPLGSLASGFGSFVSHADGQRLFLKRNLVPGTQRIKLRGVE
ncbi:MAG: substrate-binding domain-containing protein [Ignavibacteriales bacterium]|nr:substrate-binding domain-containing protein [Ignavibacteriales bacterium]